MLGSAPRPKMAKKAIWIGVAGFPLTGLWLLCIWLFSPVYLIPLSGWALTISLFIYAWPLIPMALLARRVPGEVRLKCFKCGWLETFRIETPKLRKSTEDRSPPNQV